MPEISIKLPQELNSCVQRFELWYKNTNTSRQLTWLLTHGQVEVHTLFTPRKYQLIVNVFQASILCLFNQDEIITVADIKQATRMPEEQFRSAMMMLCSPKVKLLLKKINKPVFGADEPIKCNPKFASACTS